MGTEPSQESLAARPSLEDALQQLIDSGEGDHRTVYDKLVSQHGAAWMLEQAAGRIDEWVATMFKNRLNADRRGAVMKIDAKQVGIAEVLKLKMMWVPLEGGGYNWIRVAEATADDFERRGRYQMKFALTVIQHGQWYLDTAAVMRKQKCKTANDLKEFPPLPDLDSLELAPAGEVAAIT